jgi:DNA-binding response OmpR family regulator
MAWRPLRGSGRKVANPSPCRRRAADLRTIPSIQRPIGPLRAGGDFNVVAPLTILIVDDELGVRDSIRRYLEQAGWRVHTAEAPSQALAMLECVTPDAMVLDVRMPDPGGALRSGLELLAAVRARTSLTTVPVVLLTGHLLSEQEQGEARRHRADVLYKPTGLRALEQHVRQMLRAASEALPGGRA